VNRNALLRRLVESRASVLLGRRLRAVDAEGVVVEAPDGTTLHLPADTVVTAFGTKPNTALSGTAFAEDPRVHVVGDCVLPGDVGDAVHMGFEAGASI